MSQEQHNQLNIILANLQVMYTKLHHYHWFVQGKHFFDLHTQFEELYEKFASYTDELAERILTIQGKPLSTLRDYLNTATIKEANSGESEDQMISQLIADLTQFVQELKSGMKLSEEADDQGTSDLLLGMATEIEKKIWMFSAFKKQGVPAMKIQIRNKNLVTKM